MLPLLETTVVIPLAQMAIDILVMELAPLTPVRPQIGILAIQEATPTITPIIPTVIVITTPTVILIPPEIQEAIIPTDQVATDHLDQAASAVVATEVVAVVQEEVAVDNFIK